MQQRLKKLAAMKTPESRHSSAGRKTFEHDDEEVAMPVTPNESRFSAQPPGVASKAIRKSPRSVLDMVATRAELAQQRRMDFLFQATHQHNQQDQPTMDKKK